MAAEEVDDPVVRVRIVTALVRLISTLDRPRQECLWLDTNPRLAVLRDCPSATPGREEALTALANVLVAVARRRLGEVARDLDDATGCTPSACPMGTGVCATSRFVGCARRVPVQGGYARPTPELPSRDRTGCSSVLARVGVLSEYGVVQT